MNTPQISVSASHTQPTETREQSIADWEKQLSSSFLTDKNKKKWGGLAITGIVIILLGMVWLFKNSSTHSQEPTPLEKEATTAERAPVPKLKEQQENTDSGQATTSERNSTANEDPQRAQLELQRQEQERRLIEARIKSSIMPTHSSSALSMSTNHSSTNNDETYQTVDHRQPHRLNTTGLDANSRFSDSVSESLVATNQASQIDYLQYKILQGKLIEAVLEPRAISDLPGMVCATVQRDIVGNQGRVTLIPWGSRLCGIYNAEVRKGQDRLFVVWQTLRRPDGVQVRLDSPGADQLGSSGMGGQVNSHFAQIFGISALLSIIGAGASNLGVHANDQANSAAYYRQSVQQAAAQSAQQVLQPYLNIQPTITVPAGSRIRIYVNHDLDFTSVYKDEIEVSKQHGVIFIQ